LIIDGEKQLEAIIETHRDKMSPLYSPALDARIDELTKQLNQLELELIEP
jgi:hypothetical protein